MENMDIQPETDPQISKKPSKIKAIFVAVIALALVLGGVYYFAFYESVEGPPKLEGSDQSLYQGIAKLGAGDYYFAKHDKKTRKNFEEAKSIAEKSPIQLKAGEIISLVSTKSTTALKILEAIDPESGAIMIAGFQDNEWLATTNFYGTDDVEVIIDDLKKLKFKKNEVILVSVENDAEMYNDNIVETTMLSGSFDFCNSGSDGWVLGVIAEAPEKVLEDCMEEVEVVFIDGVSYKKDKLEEIEMDTIEEFVMWVQFSEAPNKLIKKSTEAIAGACLGSTEEVVVSTEAIFNDFLSGDFEPAFDRLPLEYQVELEGALALIRGAFSNIQLEEITMVMELLLGGLTEAELADFITEGFAEVIKETVGDIISAEGTVPALLQTVSDAIENLKTEVAGMSSLLSSRMLAIINGAQAIWGSLTVEVEFVSNNKIRVMIASALGPLEFEITVEEDSNGCLYQSFGNFNLEEEVNVVIYSINVETDLETNSDPEINSDTEAADDGASV